MTLPIPGSAAEAARLERGDRGGSDDMEADIERARLLPAAACPPNTASTPAGGSISDNRGGERGAQPARVGGGVEEGEDVEAAPLLRDCRSRVSGGGASPTGATQKHDAAPQNADAEANDNAHVAAPNKAHVTKKTRVDGGGDAPCGLPRSSDSGAAADCSSPSASPSGGRAAVKVPRLVSICRICLEEDSLCRLEQPCGCAGTQSHAHHACIQRWVTEKGDTKCEICGQQYRGEYTVPLPVPPPPPSGGAPVVTSLFLMDPNNPGRLIPTDRQHVARHVAEMQQRAAGGGGGHDAEDEDFQQHPAINCVFTSCVFAFFLVVLHHSLAVTDSMDHPAHGGAHASPPPPPFRPWGPDGDGGADDLTDSVVFLLLFLLMKMLLIALPLLLVLKMAQRQAERYEMEQMVRSAYDGNRHIVIRVHRPSGTSPAGAGPPPPPPLPPPPRPPAAVTA